MPNWIELSKLDQWGRAAAFQKGSVLIRLRVRLRSPPDGPTETPGLIGFSN